jgi:hypothetical protein
MRTWIDDAVERGMARYLRTCEVGGMPASQAQAIRYALNHAGDMAVFSLSVAEDMSRQGYTFHQNYQKGGQ